jgi:hypothetical protein
MQRGKTSQTILYNQAAERQKRVLSVYIEHVANKRIRGRPGDLGHSHYRAATSGNEEIEYSSSSSFKKVYVRTDLLL